MMSINQKFLFFLFILFFLSLIRANGYPLHLINSSKKFNQIPCREAATNSDINDESEAFLKDENSAFAISISEDDIEGALAESKHLIVQNFESEEVTAVDITFRVDMSQQSVSPLGVHVAGNFQGWNPSGTEMIDVGNSVYEVTFSLDPGFVAEYKFINGNAWGMEEAVSGPCVTGPNNNRFYEVPSTSTVLPAVCFGSCNVCNPPQVSITFQVDMSQQNISPQGIFLAGTFNGWNTTVNPMNLIGNDVYALTISLGAGDYHQFKFLNGPSWESVPAACAQNQNRYLVVPAVSTTLDAFCFGSCSPCGPPPIPVEVTFRVDMSNETVSPDGVHIAGGFQGWDPGATLMIAQGNNIYSYTTTLFSGTYQEYKFINGNNWGMDEAVPEPCGVNNNRWIVVPQADTLLDVVCFGECGPCGTPPIPVEVTFTVDMANEEISPDGVHLAGSFQGWNPSETPMTNVADKIWQVTLSLLSGTYIEFKYINGNNFDGAESVPQECGVDDGFGGYSRYFTVPDENFTLSEVCFSSCDPCVPPPPLHGITFRVDLSYEVISPDGVHIAGSFQGWDPGSTPMQAVGENLYEITIELTEGNTYEYKFINGNTFNGAEIVPFECALNGNRYLTVPAQNLILDEVCFSSCDPCGAPPIEVEVTFRVDMTQQTVSEYGVHIAGSFQGWNPGSTQMYHDTNNVYRYTTTLISGLYVEYKFINGNEWGMDETVPAECAANNNRYFIVPDEDITLTAFCFGSCVECPPVVIHQNVGKIKYDIYPNPVKSQLYLSYSGEWLHITIYSVDGKTVQKEIVNGHKTDISKLKPGLYFIKLEDMMGESIVRKFIVK